MLMLRRSDRAIRAIEKAMRQPLAIEARWLDEMRGALARRDRVQIEALAFGWGSAVTSAEIENGIGRIEIRGPLFEGSFFHDYSDIREAVEQFAATPSAYAILLDIDSPGGVVAGALYELAQSIREAGERKPVVALANDQATSAAYVIASQAGRAYAVGRGAVLGSLGVIATHVDWSKMDEAAGVTVTEIVTGRRKNELSPNRPLSKEGRETLQQIVDAAFLDLIEAVQSGRDLDEDTIRAWEGGIFLGQDAVEKDLADGVRTLDEVVEMLRQEHQQPSATRAAAQEASMSETKPGASAPVNANPAQPAQVIDLDKARAESKAEGVREAEAAIAARVKAIRMQCQLGGCPERLGEFLESDLTAEQVGQKILETRAAAEDADAISGHHGSPKGKDPEIDAEAIFRRRREAMSAPATRL